MIEKPLSDHARIKELESALTALREEREQNGSVNLEQLKAAHRAHLDANYLAITDLPRQPAAPTNGGDLVSDMDRWEPVPVPQGDTWHDIGDDARAAIVRRLMEDWSRDPDLTPEKVRQLAIWAGASVRALLHELGILRDLAGESSYIPERDGRRCVDHPTADHELVCFDVHGGVGTRRADRYQRFVGLYGMWSRRPIMRPPLPPRGDAHERSRRSRCWFTWFCSHERLVMPEATPQLPKFIHDEPCPKCGCLGPALKYRPATTLLGEALYATCWRCGFGWVRSPLDAPDPASE